MEVDMKDFWLLVNEGLKVVNILLMITIFDLYIESYLIEKKKKGEP